MYRYRRHARQKNAPKPSAASSSRTAPPGINTPVGAITGRSLLQDLFRDDELHDLAGSLIDLGDLRVAVVTLGREVFQISVAPEDLHAIAAGLHPHVAREELRLPRREDVVLARVLHRGGAPREQTSRVDLRGHVGEHPLDRLEVGDLLSKGLALLGVRDRILEARAGDADRLRRDRDAAAIEGRKRDPVSLAHLAEKIRGRHARVLEDELRRVRSADAELALELAD